MGRNWKEVALVALLFLALGHAWSGHDLVGGHGHDGLGSVAYSTHSPRAEHHAPALLLLCLNPGFLFELRPTRVIERVQAEDHVFVDPIPILARRVPRPPPASTLLV